MRLFIGVGLGAGDEGVCHRHTRQGVHVRERDGGHLAWLGLQDTCDGSDDNEIDHSVDNDEFGILIVYNPLADA